MFLMEESRIESSLIEPNRIVLFFLVFDVRPLFFSLQAVDPLPFLRTVKDLDGNAIDVTVQQDAQGFLLDLFDKMEARMKLLCHVLYLSHARLCIARMPRCVSCGQLDFVWTLMYVLLCLLLHLQSTVLLRLILCPLLHVLLYLSLLHSRKNSPLSLVVCLCCLYSHPSLSMTRICPCLHLSPSLYVVTL